MTEQGRAPLWAGLLASAFGLVFVGLSIWGSGEGFQAPRWVVGAAGGVFALAGLMIVVQDFPLWAGLARASMMTAFAAVFVWVSFWPGEREFSSSVSIPFLSFTSSSPDLLGRICFAPGAIILSVLAVYFWVQLALDWVTGELDG